MCWQTLWLSRAPQGETLLSSCQSSALRITGEDIRKRGFTSLQVPGSITLQLLQQLLRKAKVGHDSSHSSGRLTSVKGAAYAASAGGPVFHNGLSACSNQPACVFISLEIGYCCYYCGLAVVPQVGLDFCSAEPCTQTSAVGQFLPWSAF